MLAVDHWLLFYTSFDLHWYSLILLGEFYHIIFDLSMHFELLQTFLSHPTVYLLKKNDRFSFSIRFGRGRHQIQIFAEPLHSLKSFQPIIVKQISDKKQRDCNYFFIPMQEVIIQLGKQQILVFVIHVPKENFFGVGLDIFLLDAKTFLNDCLDHCSRVNAKCKTSR